MKVNKITFSLLRHVNIEWTCQACGYKNDVDMGHRTYGEFDDGKLKEKVYCLNCDKPDNITIEIGAK